MATFETAYGTIKGLVKDFKENKTQIFAPDYSEQDVRNDYINKFFMALGWDILHDEQKNPHRQEVKIEKSIADKNKRKRWADYAFSLAPNYRNTVFIVEAKRPAKDLLNSQDYFQSISYATNTNTPIVVLTDFEEFHVVDARFKTTIDTALHRKIKEYRYQDYADKEKFAEIYYLFSREAVADNSIQEYTDSLPIPKSKADLKTYLPKGTKSVDESLLDELEEIRKVLAKAFKKENPSLDSYALTEATQRTIDRLVFLRFLEDKLLEPDLFVSRYARSKTPWKDFTHDCIRFNEKYNGVVFRKHFIDESSFKSPAAKTFIDVCNRLTNPDYYYDVIPIHILGSIYERFLGSVVHATAKEVTIKQKPEVKKAGGVYYTPEYIVRYIVENTIGKLIEDKSPLQISRMHFADIACGSGSFLISVFGCILDYHNNWYNDNPKKAKEDGCIYIKEDDKWVVSLKQKRKILVNNIYGVDIDEQAVEVTELSLYLKLLEDETTATAHEMSSFFTLLPDISKNIICGNSLIEPDILLSDLFGDEEERKLNPMAFDNVFPNVMNKGGFDAIVGNPPWVDIKGLDPSQVNYYFSKYPTTENRMNLYATFIDRALTKIKPEGLFGYIVPNSILFQSSYTKLRKKILDNFGIQKIIRTPDNVFENVKAEIIVLVIQKSKRATKCECLIYERKQTINSIDKREVVDFKTANPKHWRNENLSTFDIFSSQEIKNVLTKIEKDSFPLIDICDFCLGLTPYDKYKGHTQQQIKDKVFHLDHKKDETFKKLLAGANVVRYGVEWGGKNYISYGDWLGAPREPKFFKNERILVRQIVSGTPLTIYAGYTNKEFYNTQSIFNIILKPKQTVNMKFLLAILNSDLMNFYHSNKYLDLSKNLFQKILIQNCKKFPIPKIDFSNKTEKAAHDKIVQLVDQIIETKKKLATAKIDRDINYYERKCNNIDREINKEVNKLYGLSKDEIEIINE